jgi:hypothetical protein
MELLTPSPNNNRRAEGAPLLLRTLPLISEKAQAVTHKLWLSSGRIRTVSPPGARRGVPTANRLTFSAAELWGSSGVGVERSPTVTLSNPPMIQ